MKIKKLKINSYGKLKDLEIDLKDNINIIYGKNESGKSTILKFILNSFYGTSKNKKGKLFSDFDQYKPWQGEEFSGKLNYELDNGNKFEIYREFGKKNPKIFNEELEEISKEFNINKNKVNEFFYDQTKIDEEFFLATSTILQQEVKIEKNMQNILIQKIANLVGTGQDNVSFTKAINKINKRQLDEIGTERSREKPINLIEKRLQEINNEKVELEKYKEQKYNLELDKKDIIEENKKLELEKECAKEIQKINNDNKLEKEKIKIKENILKENEEKINLLKNNLQELKKENTKELQKNLEKTKSIKNKNRKIKNGLIIFIFIIILINIFQAIFIKNSILNYIFLSVAIVALAGYFVVKNKLNKKEKNKLIDLNLNPNKNKIDELENEIKIINKNKINVEQEIIKLKEETKIKNNIEKEKIKNKYLNKIEVLKINEFFILENLNINIEEIQNKISNNKVKLHSLDIDKENIDFKLEKLMNLEEEQKILSEQYADLKKLTNSMELAKEVLNIAYEEMKNTVTPKFTENLSNYIKSITNGEYSNVKYNDEIGLIIETATGDYVNVERLSVGTIDQLYLALRLSIIKELSQESIPLILDEAFAYYDNNRLKNILQFLNKEFNNLQIIIFTCTNREKEILNDLQINYNLIELK